MKVQLLIAFLVLSAYAVNIDNSLQNTAFVQKVKETSWGKVVLAMAEVAVESQGPLQELVDSIQELVQSLFIQLNTQLGDIEATINELDGQFKNNTNAYFKDKVRLEQEINDAQIAISNTSDSINNVLLPMREKNQQRLAQISEFVEDNRKKFQEEKLVREKNHAAYSERMREHQQAVDAVDECISLLQGVSNQGGSLVQVKRLKFKFELIQAKIGKAEVLGPLAQMMMQITSEQNFSDQGTLTKLIKMFNELRSDIVDEINHENASEQEAQSNYEKRVQSLNNEFTEFQRQITELTYQVAAVDTKLQEFDELLRSLKSDVAVFSEQLDELNTWYATESQIYEQLKQEYLAEQDAATKAYELVSNSDFINMIKSQI